MKGRIYQNGGGFVVRFGRDVSKYFKTLEQAERFLTGLRYETDQGKFDLRDYSRDKPLAFSNLVEKYLQVKKQKVKPSSYRNVKNYLGKAVAAWGQANVKAIGYAEIDDFLTVQEVASKTRHDMRGCLHAFWVWMVNRDVLDRLPKFPEYPFKMGMRTVIDLETQQNIINEVDRISGHISPKIGLGIRFLATYYSIRPAEMLSLREGQIDHKLGCFVIPSPKEKEPKVVNILDEDLAALKQMPRGLPDLYFFRHDKTANGAKAGQRFGQRMFYKWWVRACMNLGVEGVDLYGGTKHSTATALGAVLSPEQIRHGSMHKSNAAFERYFQGQPANAKRAYAEARKLQRPYNGKSRPEATNAL